LGVAAAQGIASKLTAAGVVKEVKAKTECQSGGSITGPARPLLAESALCVHSVHQSGDEGAYADPAERRQTASR
jgi:hypothetical protein